MLYNDARTFEVIRVRNFFVEMIRNFGIEPTPMVQIAVMLAVIVAVCVVIYAVMLYGLWGAVKRYNREHPRPWLSMLIESNIFTLVVLTVQGMIVSVQVRMWIPGDSAIYGFLDVCTRLWILVFAMLAVFALLNLTGRALQRTRIAEKIPLNGVVQALKLVVLVVFLILIASTLLGRSPVLLLSGLSAMTAVLMLIFQNPIMGFVSGLQLTGYNMLAVGDWVEIPKYNADGDVVEIGLTTVKIQNWDRTIVTVPTSALMSDSFKNWRGMTQSGGRRIKRSVNIDIDSIRFLSEEDCARLKRARLISGYLAEKAEELEKFNKSIGDDGDLAVNGRHLTNIGTFRIYLLSYLRAHPKIHKGMTLMVRQLAPTSEGLPLEVYVFTNTTAWVEYENIQADIFDHIFAILPEFGLRAYQAPSGADFRSIAKN